MKNQLVKITLAAFALSLAACGTNGFATLQSKSGSGESISTLVPTIPLDETTSVMTPGDSTTAVTYVNKCTGTPHEPGYAFQTGLNTGGVCAVKVMSLGTYEGLILSIPDGNGGDSNTYKQCASIATGFQANYDNVCFYYISMDQARSVGVVGGSMDPGMKVQTIIANFGPIPSSNR